MVRQTLDRDWTGNPISVQSLSRLCPLSVHVQGLSACCPVKVEICQGPVQKSEVWTEIGYENPGFVQELSNKILSDDQNYLVGQSLDLWHTQNPPMAHSRQMPNSHQVPDYQSYTTTGYNFWTNY